MIFLIDYCVRFGDIPCNFPQNWNQRPIGIGCNPNTTANIQKKKHLIFLLPAAEMNLDWKFLKVRFILQQKLTDFGFNNRHMSRLVKLFPLVLQFL